MSHFLAIYGPLGTGAISLLASIVVVAIALEHFMGFKLDPKEPPLIPQRIPYVGHLISILRHGARFYLRMR